MAAVIKHLMLIEWSDKITDINKAINIDWESSAIKNGIRFEKFRRK